MTADGNDNEGGLTLSYGYEDTDMIGTKAVFNAHDSKLWCSVRDYFADDLDALYIQLEGKLAWNAQRILKKFEDYQGVKPERLVIADMRRKYFRTYEDNGTTSYLPMMNGDKKHQRRQFERYHGKYEASKHVGAECTSDVMTIRGYTPTEWAGVKPDGTFHIKPYADTYIVCRYGSNLVKVRGKRGETYEIKSPIAAMNDTEVYVYNASLIQSIGSIAGFYPGYVDFGQGIKLTDLSIGSGEEGYANTNMTDFDIGNNVLLEHLDLRNVPNLKKSISLKGCVNLETFYAEGSGITGVEFAPGGKITTAHLPASIASLTAKNILYMTDFVMAGYDSLTTLVMESSPSMDAMGIVNAAQNLARTRMTGLDWKLDGTEILERLLTLGGIDENGYVTAQSVLEGKAFVPIMREQYLRMFMDAWKDLYISYNTMIQQFIWTFMNGETEVDVQYIDKGECAVDPVTREENPIAVPTKESSVSTVFTFKGWDTEFTPAFSNQIVQAMYDEAVRQYRVRYMNKGEVLQEHQKDYASTDLYEGETPVYTAEEIAYKYHLFKEWDKSGFVDGDKDINAVYDTCEYTSGYFDGRDLSELRPVEIYAMIQTGNESIVSDKDSISFSLGNDFSFTDITQKTLIANKTIFDGRNYVDTQESLLSEDRSFVLAIDYKFEQNTNGGVLAQCYETNGMNGFRLWYNNNATRAAWSTNSEAAASVGVREMMVLRHIKGENSIHVYFTDKSNMEVRYAEIERTKSTVTNATLVFGCSKADDGVYENFAKGTIYWAKVWYVDLGDKACRQLAAWPHEDKVFEMTGQRRYYLSNNTSKRCSMTFLCTTVLDGDYQLHTVQNNIGGWPAYTLNTYLNRRMVDAFPVQWRQLIKTVKVPSSAGGMSTEIVTGDSMFYIPSIAEINTSFTSEPYCYEGTAISFMAMTDERVRKTEDGVAKTYFTRSPNASYSGYVHVITDTGYNSGYYYPTDTASVVLMFSI